jgi:hypothetical protein
MAFEPGGMADKLGNRYEGRWIAKQLLKLLNEEIRSVTVEPMGSEEEGVDLQIVKKDGVYQLQQCKARFGNHNSWSVSALRSKGILDHMKAHLSRHAQQEFVLVSSIPAQPLSDICESARNSNENPNDFFDYQIQKIGKPRIDAFHDFCNALGLREDQENDLIKAFDYLKRLYFENFPDDHNSWSDLLAWAGFLLTGEPENAIDVLIAYAGNNYKYRKPLYSNELRVHLVEYHNIHPKNLSHDGRIAPVVEELRLQFSESIRPGLIHDRIIPREETKQIVECIESGKNVVLHGAAGSGKSGILLELTEYLHHKRIPFLSVRLDRRIPDKTAKQFGKDLGLPESPVLSLAGLAAGRKSVLILDQLDAIRWTSAHSSAAMDVCKELVRQARSFRRESENIVIVFACRTFDLENDLEIKGLIPDKKDQKFVKIESKELSSDQLKSILGNNFDVLTDTQKRILTSPYNLAIWIEINRNGKVPDFRSATDLMRRFWKGRRKIIEEKSGIPAGKVDAFLQPILDYVENKGEISIPSSVAAGNPRILNVLISYGIFQENANRISFSHQKYVDHLIAERLLRRIFTGEGSLLSWIGTRNDQSLIRREQLRQVLTILAEESPSDFLIHAREVLESTKVRFHLKHLVLEVIGLLNEIKVDLGRYCLELLNTAYWKEHFLETVFWGHPPWILYLLDQRIIQNWLDSEDKYKKNRAFWLLSSVANHIPDHVTDALMPYIEKDGNGLGHILSSICWNESDDSEKMFEMRLLLARKGYAKDFVNWKSFCSKYPLRSIRLIEAVLSTWRVEHEQTSPKQKGRLERWFDEDSKSLDLVAKKHAVETWDLLIGHIDRLTSFVDSDPYEPRLARWRDSGYDHKDEDISRGTVQLVISAGQTLAADQPEVLVNRVLSLQNSISPIIREIIISSYTHLSTNYTDVGIRWILGDTARFRAGSGYGESEWMPTVRLILSLSPHCSIELFRQLENAIIHYHSPEEKRDAEYYLKRGRNGYFGHYWGTTQFLLLPALDKTRILGTTKNLIRVLERKFEACHTDRFLRAGRVTGGWVQSKLDPNLEKISDNSWIKIVSSEKVAERRHRKGIQLNQNLFLETSVFQFANSLSQIAKHQPERFGQLALRFPDTIDPNYISAILGSLSQKHPDANLPEDEKKAWKPARVETIEAILSKYPSGNDREVAMSFCRLIEARADQNWSRSIIERLVNYAINHPDLAPGKLNLHCDKENEEASVDTLFQNILNCVRGRAACVIGQLLWEQEGRLEQLRASIESLIKDPHPVVQMAAIYAIEPVLNIDKELAVRWFCLACKDDLRVAASHKALSIFNYIIPEYIEQVTPIILQMVGSSMSDVAMEGARQVTARWLFYGFFEKELIGCCEGNMWQRKGVASVAAFFLCEREYSIKCRKLLRRFINDSHKEVRNELNGLFRRPQLNIGDSDHHVFLQEYIKSQAFQDSSDNLVHLIENCHTNLIPIADTIFAVCKEFAMTLKEKSRDPSSSHYHVVTDMLPILLRLYEQATGERNHEIKNQCLDIWDILFENRVGRAIELTRSIES